MNKDEKIFLLHLARKSIENAVANLSQSFPESPFQILNEKRGAFVTLHKGGYLRGCIGFVEAYKPLIETVWEMAEAAALQDPRFPPVSSDELDEIEIEISVLSPLRKISNPDEIKVGEDGILIKKGFYSGLLLPQVAVRYNWDNITFLEETCLKAGLERDEWKEDAEILAFTAEIFSEKDFGIREFRK